MKMIMKIIKIKKMNGWIMLNKMFYVLLSLMRDTVNLCKKKTGFSMKDFSSAPELGWKYFNSLRDENDEPIHTFNDKYMR